MNEDKIVLQVGIDDTDSPRAYCTTYATFRTVKEITSKYDVEFLDYPLLVRLNPNVPWKTRGNGANAMRLRINSSDLDGIKYTIAEMIKQNSDLDHERTDPTIVFVTTQKLHTIDSVRNFYIKALRDIVNLEEAFELSEKIGADIVFLKEGSNRGLVGALAALGALIPGDDFTYELLVYRKREKWGERRLVDEDSVKMMDKLTRPMTFNNYDYEEERVLITPRGPDPVLAGIRGEEPWALTNAVKLLRFGEQYEGWMIFRTNQGTDAHLPATSVKIKEIEQYKPIKLCGRISDNPIRIAGGHVVSKIADDSGEADIIVYEQGGKLRDVLMELREGDFIEVYGCAKTFGQSVTVNVEKLVVKTLVDVVMKMAPRCSTCNKRCKSKGRDQGYECEKCGRKMNGPEYVRIERDLDLGTYLPPPRSQRHLTKPLVRYGKEKSDFECVRLYEPWYSF
jgi:tRNA(Ile2)-agmatinylcytidine synthase